MVNNKADSPARRGFLTRVWGFLGLAAVLQLLAGTVLFLGSEKKQAGKEAVEKLQAGDVADFPPGSVTLIARGHLYLSRLDDGGFLAISRKCTHLGCAVPWVEERKQFECPCHASVFDMSGQVLKSPAPRALDIFPVSFEGDRVVIDVSAPIRRSVSARDQLAYLGERA